MKNILMIILSFFAVFSAKSQDSDNVAITRRVGMTAYPLEGKIGLTYCFGPKGEIKIENAFEPSFASKPFTMSLISNETKLLYAWNSSSRKKLYSGLAATYQDPDYSGYALYGSVIPIALEWFPLNRVQNASLIIEPDIGPRPGYAGGVYWEVHIGLCCYF
jgi:hypothetical protein